ncbi:sugar ABC transporter permease (plasmid) [Thermus thermophilus]|uniref:ABC-type transporter, integral membrane subunit n=2 Tax=Thermus thermophilus TaxID=274 RepID=F6DJG2_THETG|nr:sugar ABC transporter permease [Thermus thermophilus]AEG34559.1 ABC-type transporter, integral membrane subunit [Thermus thermophilus SG0.5JP17-16]AFH39912.1 permease component of ABC-type sugar transporter [Thermus thermophilus JL-18]
MERDDRAVFRRPVMAWALLLPTLVILSLFLYYPTIQTFLLSFYQVNFALIFADKIFVGLENYKTVFTDPVYRRVLLNTLLFSGSVVALSLVTGLALAVLANQKVRGARVYRLLLIWPYALSPAVAGVIFLFLFNPQAGVVNYVLGEVFGVRPDWLTDPRLAFLVVVLTAVWKNVGYNVVFYLAALQNLPGEVLEAALVDGATPWQRFFRITLPLLSPMTFFLLVMNSIYAFFDTFAIIDLITRGGPNGATNTLIYSIYRDGFEFFNTGMAAAQSVVLFVGVVLLTMVQFRFGERRVHYGG